MLPDKVKLEELTTDSNDFKTLRNLMHLADLEKEKIERGNFATRARLTEEASATITGEINEYWDQEEIGVKVNIDGEHLGILIQDKTGAYHRPSLHSDGFQWFLGFYINFMAGTQRELKDAVLLLDNLGLKLHPSGQKTLLNILKEIGDRNQILFSTHSPFLINPDNLSRVRIVEKKREKKGTKITEDYHKKAEFDALEPIRAAIGARLSDSLFGSPCTILVEGRSDKIYLESVSKYFNRRNKHGLNLSFSVINAARGADKIPYYTSFLSNEGFFSLVILDHDTKGRDVKAGLLEENIVQERAIVTLDLFEEHRDAEIEDLFNAECERYFF